MNGVAAAERKLPYKFSLRASVSVTERMYGIDFAKIVAGAGAEASPVQLRKISFVPQFAKDFVEAGRDMFYERKEELP